MIYLESLGEAFKCQGGVRKGNKETHSCVFWPQQTHYAIVFNPDTNSGSRCHHAQFTDEVIEGHKVNWRERYRRQKALDLVADGMWQAASRS